MMRGLSYAKRASARAKGSRQGMTRPLRLPRKTNRSNIRARDAMTIIVGMRAARALADCSPARREPAGSQSQ